MSSKMKVNPGSGGIWNLITVVFRGGPPPIVHEIVCSEYILWRLYLLSSFLRCLLVLWKSII